MQTTTNQPGSGTSTVKRQISYLWGLVLLGMLCSCRQQQQQQPPQQQQEDTSNRSYFTIEGVKMVVPVQLNDSVKAKLFFDSGAGLLYCEESIVLDTSIVSKNPTWTQNSIRETSRFGSDWSQIRMRAIFYDSLHLKLKLGNTDIVYSGICATSYKNRYRLGRIGDEGMFNVPKNDTTHIWELNFENNYMEVHPADSYNLPSDCLVFPLEGTEASSPFFVTLPLKLRFPDNDTLTIHRKFYIDSGVACEVFLLSEAPEKECLDRRKDAVWLPYWKGKGGRNGYRRYYTATATLCDAFTLDSLRVYTLDYKRAVSCPYYVGLNFLKRFNCFFDMKNKRLGLQPHRNFHRAVDPLVRRFYYSTQKSRDGRFVVDYVADYQGNYYQEAGLQAGDEIVSIVGVPYGELTLETARLLYKLDSLAVDIVRNGKPQTLWVKLNPNEPTED